MKRFGFLLRGMWLLGIVLGLVGVGMARLSHHWVAPAHLRWWVLSGELLGLLGLVTIAVGVSRRLKQETSWD